MDFADIQRGLEAFLGPYHEEVIATVVVSIVLGPLWRGAREVSRRVGGFLGAREKLALLDRRLTAVRRGGRWERRVGWRERRLQRQLRNGIPIVFIGNNKGGVGKTTLTAGLGAYFALKRGKRVLFIDLDFQSNLSEPLRYMSQVPADDFDYRLRDLFIDDAEPGARLDSPWSIWRFWELGRLFSARRRAASVSALLARRRTLIGGHDNTLPFSFDGSAFYDCSLRFSDLEDYVWLRWAAGRARVDARFRLARFLASPEVQAQFDLVLIDSPPRWTLGAVNGFCAATHLLVPTRAETLSFQGCKTYLNLVTVERRRLNPNVGFLGFVRTFGDGPHAFETVVMTEPMTAFIADVAQERLDFPGGDKGVLLVGQWPEGSRFEFIGHIPERDLLRQDAHQRIAYDAFSETRPFFELAGGAVSKALDIA